MRTAVCFSLFTLLRYPLPSTLDPFFSTGYCCVAAACRSAVQLLTVLIDKGADLIHIVQVSAIQSAPHRSFT